MANPWFRMYVDFLDDPKILSLAFEDQRHFIGVLALKCSGVIDQECSLSMLDKMVAQKLWIDHSAIQEVKRRLVDAGLIDMEWQPVAWDKRQFVSDRDPTKAERQARHREKQRNALRNAPSNAPVTLTDTDTDTDKEEPKTSSASGDAAKVFVTKKKRKLKGRQLEMFERFWTVFDHKKDKAQAADAWFDLHVTETLFSAIVLGAEATARERPDAIKAGRTPIYAQGWLSGRRWEDEIGDKKESASPEDYSRYLNAIRAQQ